MRSSQPSPNTLDALGIFDLMVKALTFPQPEPEKPARRDPRADEVEASVPGRPRGLLERLEQWFRIRQQRGVESHLAKATDAFEVEARKRAPERQIPHPYY